MIFASFFKKGNLSTDKRWITTIRALAIKNLKTFAADPP